MDDFYQELSSPGAMVGRFRVASWADFINVGYFVRLDGGYDPDCNVHHWAWGFAMGYDIGARGTLINTLREVRQAPVMRGAVDNSDISLGNAGVLMGDALAVIDYTYADIPDLLSLVVSYTGQ